MNLQNRKEAQRLKRMNVLGGRMGGRDNYGVWVGHVHTAIFKMESQQVSTV